MSKSPIWRAVLFAGVLLSGRTTAEPHRVALPVGAQKAIFELPEGWEQSDHRVVEGAITAKFSAPKSQLTLLVTALFFPAPPEVDVQSVVREMNKDNAAESIEQQCAPKLLKRVEGAGAFCEFTDADLDQVTSVPAGQYKYVSAGLVLSKGLAINFTILTNDVGQRAYAEALGVMEHVVVAGPVM